MQILRLPYAIKKIGLSKSAIYDRLDKKSKRHDATFPRPVPLGGGKNSPIGFVESELDEWLDKQLAKREAK